MPPSSLPSTHFFARNWPRANSIRLELLDRQRFGQPFAGPLLERGMCHHRIHIGARGRRHLDRIGAKAMHHRPIHSVRAGKGTEQEGAAFAIAGTAITPKFLNAGNIGSRANVKSSGSLNAGVLGDRGAFEAGGSANVAMIGISTALKAGGSINASAAGAYVRLNAGGSINLAATDEGVITRAGGSVRVAGMKR